MERNLKEQKPKCVEPFLVEIWAKLLSSVREWSRKRRKPPQTRVRRNCPNSILSVTKRGLVRWIRIVRSPGLRASHSSPPIPHRVPASERTAGDRARHAGPSLQEAPVWRTGDPASPSEALKALGGCQQLLLKFGGETGRWREISQGSEH